MSTIGQPNETARKYFVLRRLGAWRVELEARSLGVFRDAEEAIDLACRLARDDARGGQVATVTTETSPQELHCFVPPPGQGPAVAPQSRQAPHLRLVNP
ncbi:MAG TPA: hypothetical protein VHY34_11940 [Caulobacteraceae bacterium]|jgi:hypothetical protein|nr:hypothetical protein [Caulobacteraceae bacterium]